jgi:hypothetical protein
MTPARCGHGRPIRWACATLVAGAILPARRLPGPGLRPDDPVAGLLRRLGLPLRGDYKGMKAFLSEDADQT